MTVTPWEEARLDLVTAAGNALHDWMKGPQDGPVGPAESTINAALTTLSRLGYRIVPAEATEKMVNACAEVDSCSSSYGDVINAAIAAGDVLKEGK
jgi:hypothetical protein